MPPSDRKLQSARANGAKSNGPHTPEGRQAVALNSVKHGLTAQTVILQNESPDEYQAELNAYIDHFQPQGIAEQHLVHQLGAAAWRLARYVGVESGLLNDKMDDQTEWIDEKHGDVPNKQRVAIAFDALSGPSSSLTLLNRYEARLHHEYQRLLRSLSQMQTARQSAEAKLPSEPNPISGRQPITTEE
jgi:hypothetical protein